MRVSTRAAGGLAALPLLQACGGGGAPDGQTVVPPLAVRNAYRQTNLAASKAAYGAAFTLPDMVDAWGIAIRPAGAGGHFWVLGGGTSWQFVGDVTASPDPKFKTVFQDGLGQVSLPGAEALATDASLGKATGTAFNGAAIASDHFRVTAQSASVNGATVEFDGSARFVFVTDSGKISAWTDRARDGSTVRVDGPAQLVYDGSALGMSLFGVALKTDTWDTLWAADFGATPQIRQFDKAWRRVPTQGFANPFASGPLLDAANPAQGQAARPGEPVPFNIHVLGTRVFVMYCISQVLRRQRFHRRCEQDLAERRRLARCGRRGPGWRLFEPRQGCRVHAERRSGDGVRRRRALECALGVAVAPADFGLMSNTLFWSATSAAPARSRPSTRPPAVSSTTCATRQVR